MDFNKEILSNDDHYELIREVVNEIGDVVTSTLGPDGLTKIIKNYNGEYYITKDGVSVLKSIGYVNSQKQIICNIIKEIAVKTVKEAGDGTTTSILFAQLIILTGINLLQKGVKYNEIKKELDKLEEVVLKEIKDNTKQITTDREEFIKRITTISSNGDKSIVKLVLEAFSHSDNIKIVEDINLKDNIDKQSGYIIERKNKSINQNVPEDFYKDIKVIVINDKLTSFSKDFSKQINKNKNNLIIAHSFNSHVVEKVFMYNKQYTNKIILIEAPGMSEFKELLIQDISAYCNLEKNNGYYVNEKDVEIKVEFNKIVLFTHNDNQLKKRINYLSDALKKTDDKVSQQSIQFRLDRLNSKTVTIHVGGESNIESKERKDRVEDAVLAVNCALEEGYLSGGGMFMRSLYDEYSDLMFSDIFLIPSKKLEENGTNVENVDTTLVIDPSKVTRTAFKNALSISKTLLSTSALITSPYELQNE